MALSSLRTVAFSPATAANYTIQGEDVTNKDLNDRLALPHERLTDGDSGTTHLKRKLEFQTQCHPVCRMTERQQMAFLAKQNELDKSTCNTTDKPTKKTADKAARKYVDKAVEKAVKKVDEKGSDRSALGIADKYDNLNRENVDPSIRQVHKSKIIKGKSQPIQTKILKGKPALWTPQEYSNWSSNKKEAWKAIVSNPHHFYYHYLPPGVVAKNSDWKDEEISDFRRKLKLYPCMKLWGYFAMHISGRTGKQCHELHKKLSSQKTLQHTNRDKTNKRKRKLKVSESSKRRKTIHLNGKAQTPDPAISRPTPDPAVSCQTLSSGARLAVSTSDSIDIICNDLETKLQTSEDEDQDNIQKELHISEDEDENNIQKELHISEDEDENNIQKELHISEVEDENNIQKELHISEVEDENNIQKELHISEVEDENNIQKELHISEVEDENNIQKELHISEVEDENNIQKELHISEVEDENNIQTAPSAHSKKLSTYKPRNSCVHASKVKQPGLCIRQCSRIDSTKIHVVTPLSAVYKQPEATLHTTYQFAPATKKPSTVSVSVSESGKNTCPLYLNENYFSHSVADTSVTDMIIKERSFLRWRLTNECRQLHQHFSDLFSSIGTSALFVAGCRSLGGSIQPRNRPSLRSLSKDFEESKAELKKRHAYEINILTRLHSQLAPQLTIRPITIDYNWSGLTVH